MEMLLAWLGAGSGGSFIAVGAAANARLRQVLHSPIAAATVNFVVGFIILTLLLGVGVFSPQNLSKLPDAPWWSLTGGVLGAAFVAVNALIVPKLGLTPTTLTVVFSQMVGSLVVDQMGWFGAMPHPITPSRLLAIGLLLGAIALTQLDRDRAHGHQSPQRQ